MAKPAKVLRTAVIRVKVPRWISQRAFVHEINEILSTAAPALWTGRHPRTDDYQHHQIERLRAAHPKKGDLRASAQHSPNCPQRTRIMPHFTAPATTDIPLDTILRLNAERTAPITRYEEDGACDRFAYLRDLADNYGVPLAALIDVADLLGADEDFDGLVSTIEDSADGFGFAAAVFAEEA
jgi:hypothetical protein